MAKAEATVEIELTKKYGFRLLEKTIKRVEALESTLSKTQTAYSNAIKNYKNLEKSYKELVKELERAKQKPI